MTTDTALIEKRDELKRRLAAGEYITLVDVYLDWFDRLIRKITQRTIPLPGWYIVLILTLVYYLALYLISYVEGDLDNLYRLIKPPGAGRLIVISLGPVFFIVSTIIINQYIHRIFNLWRDSGLDATESNASLKDFERWLKLACNRKLHLVVTISGGLLGGVYVTILVSNLAHQFMGYWYTFGAISILLYFYALVYLVLIAVILSANLRRYEMKLFGTDPSSSELIFQLSGMLNSIVYFVAAFAAFLTFIAAVLGLLLELSIIAVFVLWLPIIIMFILNQTSLSSIIRRAKWKTLNEIQTKVENLRSVGNFEEKETLEAINRIMDYHDRVKATRNSAIDLGTILNFINSLLLPLLAFILGNLEVVLNLFVRKP